MVKQCEICGNVHQTPQKSDIEEVQRLRTVVEKYANTIKVAYGRLNALEAENAELRKRVAFLRSCVNGKEELSDKDNAWIDAALEGGKDE